MFSMHKQGAALVAALFAITVQAAAPVSEVGGDSGYASSVGGGGAITPKGSLEERVALLERTFNARLRMQAELQQQVDGLQGEVSQLRGQLEQQAHQLEQSQQRQRQLFQELDKVTSSVPASPASKPELVPADGVKYSTDQDENRAYDTAVNMVLNAKDYDKAIPAFESFIKQFPNSSYVPNAHYWLGQLLFNKGEKATAANHFSKVVDKYPSSPKRADALLKLGMLAQLDGKKGEAKSLFEQVIKGYPNTTTAKLAQQSIAKL